MIDVELSGVFLPLEAWVGGVVGELSDESLLQHLVDNASCDEWMFGGFVEFGDGEIVFFEQSREDVFVEGQSIGGELWFHVSVCGRGER